MSDDHSLNRTSQQSASRERPSGRRREPAQVATTADLVVLSLLAERPMHGWDLRSEYDRQELVDWASVSKSQLYYALSKLAEQGLIAGIADPDSARERVAYRTTPAGRAVLRRALAEPQWAHTRQPAPFCTWLGLSIHGRAPANRAMLTARRDFLRGEIDRERASLLAINGYGTPRAERGAEIVDLVIAQLEVELEWVEKLMDRRDRESRR